MARRPDPDTRQRILAPRRDSFDTYGVHAVGLQQIIDELGCGKNLLYREFATKDDLVAAYLQRCRSTWSSIIEQAMSPLPEDPAPDIVSHGAREGDPSSPYRDARDVALTMDGLQPLPVAAANVRETGHRAVQLDSNVSTSPQTRSEKALISRGDPSCWRARRHARQIPTASCRRWG